MTALSIHIGLNRVDPVHYDGWDGQLRACEQDAKDMCAIADANGFSSTSLITAQATANSVLRELSKAAATLKAGDTLLLSYSGHGGQIPDEHHDEDDGRDETWVLYDRMITDDELWDAWSKFAPGVRIFMLSDSCHSGTMARQMVLSKLGTDGRQRVLEAFGMDEYSVPRLIPPSVQLETYRRNKALYDSIQRAVPKGDESLVRASILLISGCQDNQLSFDGPVNGAFTAELLNVWNKGAFNGDHREFHKQILARMSDMQSPNFLAVGTRNPGFEREVPFRPSAGRSAASGVLDQGNCCFVLDVTSGLPVDATEEQVRELLIKQGCDVLAQAFVSSQLLKAEIFAKAGAIPRDGSASLNCSADSHGEVHCTGSVTINF